MIITVATDEREGKEEGGLNSGSPYLILALAYRGESALKHMRM